jgi:hypothetical protein
MGLMSGEADTAGGRWGQRLVNFIDGSTFEEAKRDALRTRIVRNGVNRIGRQVDPWSDS